MTAALSEAAAAAATAPAAAPAAAATTRTTPRDSSRDSHSLKFLIFEIGNLILHGIQDASHLTLRFRDGQGRFLSFGEDTRQRGAQQHQGRGSQQLDLHDFYWTSFG